MHSSWIASVLYGLFSGLADILPVSAEAHRVILLKLFGEKGSSPLMALGVHMGVLIALYICCQTVLVKLLRARALANVPKRRRKRPLDTKSLMDLSLWKTMLLPVILGFLFYSKARPLGDNFLWVACFLFLNGLILYIPQFLPGGNKDSRSLSRVDGLIMGLGGGLSVLPGISAMGATISLGLVLGIDKAYALQMALLMNLGVNLGHVIMDIIALVSTGLGSMSLVIVGQFLVGGLMAALATFVAVKLMKLLSDRGFSIFAYYCWGIALYTFILNLMA